MKTNPVTKASLRKSASLTKAMVLAGSISAMLALGTPSAHAQIIANFTGGNDTTNGGTATPGPDTYKGAAGNGWSGPWATAGNTPGKLTGTVSTTSPLAGGGNYLLMTDVAGDGNDSNLSRAYGGNGVSATVNQTISFNYELDTAISGGSYVTVGDSAAGAAGVGGLSSFIIRDYATATGTAAANTWALYNGPQNSGPGLNSNLFVNSTIAVVAGDVYAFTINLNPSTLTYTATIADTTAATTYTSGTLDFRTGGTLTDAISFNDKNTGSSDLQYSIDNVDIAAAPEPTSVSYLIGGFFALIAIGYRKARQARA